MRSYSLLLAAVALTASACSQPAQDGSAKGVSNGNADHASNALAAPRPGLWEQTISGGDAPQPVTFRTCVGEPAPGDNPFAPPSNEDGECQKSSFNKTPTGMNFETVCGSHGMTITSKGVVTGDLRSRYEAVVDMKMSGAELPPGTPAEGRLRVVAHRIGDCPAGVEPDTILP